MTTFSRYRSIVTMTFLFIFFIAAHAQAEDYKWLKTSDYKNIFVHTDFNNCDFIEGKLIETIKRTLARYKIKATISDSLVFQAADEKGKSARELIDTELINGNKIILYVYGKCIEYNSAYVYQFDIHFGTIDRRYSQAHLYSSPHHNALGVHTFTGIDREFRKLVADAVDDYLSANKNN